jgi:hypothetical protein
MLFRLAMSRVFIPCSRAMLDSVSPSVTTYSAEDPEAPEVPGAAEVPVAAEVPGVPDAPEAPEVPGAPEDCPVGALCSEAGVWGAVCAVGEDGSTCVVSCFFSHAATANTIASGTKHFML